MPRQIEPPQPYQDSGLPAFADELLLAIIEKIDSHSALCNLAATSSRFQGLVEPYVWRSLLVTHGEHARDIAHALDSREGRPSYVYELSVRYPHDKSNGIEELTHFIGLMEKLRHLTIESPCPNNSEYARPIYFDGFTKIDYRALLEAATYPRAGLSPALPMLQSLTLHGHGPDDNKFVFGRSAVMFFHPTLRRITLSCTNFDAKITHDSIPTEKKKATPLQSLTLIECNVNVKFLDVVLSLPKALKELDIGERQHIFPECIPSHDPTKRTSHPVFLSALARQAESLEKLTHTSGHQGYKSHRQSDEIGDGRLRNLVNLQYIELGTESVLFTCLQNGDYPDSLKTLKVTDSAWSNQIGDLEDLIRYPGQLLKFCNDAASKCMNRPVDVDICFNNSKAEQNLSTIEPSTAAKITAITGYPVRKPLYDLVTTLRSRNARLRLFSKKFSGVSSYIPPYMLGEEEPHEVQFYDSEDFWRLSGQDNQVLDDDEFRAEERETPRPEDLPASNV